MTPPNVLEATLKQLVKVLRSPGCRKQPVFVKDKGMSIELALGFVKEKYRSRTVTGKVLTGAGRVRSSWRRASQARG